MVSNSYSYNVEVHVWADKVSSAYIYNLAQGCDFTKVKNPFKNLAWVSCWYRGQSPPEPPGCLILEYLQTLHIPTNKKLEIWTQHRLLLSFLCGYFSFGRFVKNPEIEKNPEKSQA